MVGLVFCLFGLGFLGVGFFFVVVHVGGGCFGLGFFVWFGLGFFVRTDALGTAREECTKKICTPLTNLRPIYKK